MKKIRRSRAENDICRQGRWNNTRRCRASPNTDARHQRKAQGPCISGRTGYPGALQPVAISVSHTQKQMGRKNCNGLSFPEFVNPAQFLSTCGTHLGKAECFFADV